MKIPFRKFLILGVVTVALAGCRGFATRPTATPGVPANETVAPLPPAQSEASAEIGPDKGGAVALEDGALLTVPPQALAGKAQVSLLAAVTAPLVPVPRSLVGRAYEFSLAQSELTGVALLRLPLPPDMTPDQFDIAPYRWSGKTWERVNGRTTAEGIQVGASRPGIYALQGQWTGADATLALAKPETPVGQQTVPLVAVGQYRYSILPALQDGLVPARLVLKQDTSGGAGRVTGDDTLDKTVDEAELRFKPDPAAAQGVIQFEHTFQLAPGSLALAPGDASRFYAVLTVADSATPTRRLSNGIDYTQALPILAVGKTIVRPKLATEGERELRWHVERDGQTVALTPATGTTLEFEPILAQGGLGDYRFTLEVNRDGKWVAVSNEVSVKLALRPTLTPPPGVGTPPPEQIAIVTPTPSVGGTTTPGSGAPQIPTPRPTPGGSGGRPATATPTAGIAQVTPTVTATRPAWATVFWADNYTLTSGQCTYLRWQVDNVTAVYFNSSPVTGTDSRQVCPTQTTDYTLRIVSTSGTQEKQIQIVVGTDSQPAIAFAAESYQIISGQCTTLHWSATNVQAVYLNNQGVPGESSQSVCPTVDTVYELRVENTAGTSSVKRLTIRVVSESAPAIRFWAERYTLPAGVCTMLHWNVQNVSAVFLDDIGVPGVGSSQLCPGNATYTTLRVVDTAGNVATKELTLYGGEPTLGSNEVIARGVVNEAAQVLDYDPNSAGDQAGIRLRIDGISPLFSGIAGWGQQVITLGAPMPDTGPYQAEPIDWPISPGQQVEFRATCINASCLVTRQGSLYLRTTSQ